MLEKILKTLIAVFFILMIAGYFISQQAKSKSSATQKSSTYATTQNHSTNKNKETPPEVPITSSIEKDEIDHVKNSTIKTVDEYRKIVIYTGPTCSYSSNKTCIESNDIPHQLPPNESMTIEPRLFAGYSLSNDSDSDIGLSFDINSKASAKFRIAEVIDKNGNYLKYRRTDSKVDCNKGSCTIYERGSIRISKQYLLSNLNNGIDLLVSTDSEDRKLFFPPSYIKGFLEALPSERFK